MMCSWPFICCRNITSRNVRCASVLFWKASKIFFSATVSLVRLSTALHTIPYAPLPSFWRISYLRSTGRSISSDIHLVLLGAMLWGAVCPMYASGPANMMARFPKAKAEQGIRTYFPKRLPRF